MSDEQRATPREKLALAIKLGDGSIAVTDNLSASGLYLRLPEHQSLADDVSFQLHLAKARLTFTGDGKVVRRERRDGDVCVAIQFVTCRLTRDD